MFCATLTFAGDRGFTTVTPGQILLDAGGLALNFVPGGIGAAGGRVIRGVADDIVTDPKTWWAFERYRTAFGTDRGSIRPGFWMPGVRRRRRMAYADPVPIRCSRL